jgi:hypothetical protein
MVDPIIGSEFGGTGFGGRGGYSDGALFFPRFFFADFADFANDSQNGTGWRRHLQTSVVVRVGPSWAPRNIRGSALYHDKSFP